MGRQQGVFLLSLFCVALIFVPGAAQSNSTNDTTDAPVTNPPPTDPPVPPEGPYTITYQIDYSDRDCFMQTNMSDNGTYFFDFDDPADEEYEVTMQEDITIGRLYTVQQVMEVAVDNHSLALKFRIQYTSSGYFVKGIGDVFSNNDCMWFLYYKDQNMPYDFIETAGVSEFNADPNSTVIMRYQYPPIHAVYYEVEYPHPTNCSLEAVPNPDPLTIDLYFGAPNFTYSVQRVMEMAADMDPSNQFQVTYYGWRRGYEIDSINGTLNHDECIWHFFYIPPRTLRESARNYSNISYFNVEANSTILMSFQLIEEDTVIMPIPEPEEPETSSAVPLPVETTMIIPLPMTTQQTQPPSQPPATSMVILPMMSPSPSSAGTKLNVDIFPMLCAIIASIVIYQSF